MKIETMGFKITELGEKIKSITSDGAVIRIDETSLWHSAGLSIIDIDILIEALDKAKSLLMKRSPEESSKVDETDESLSNFLVDRSGDIWTLDSDHDNYVLHEKEGACVNGHGRNCGQALAWVQENWAPVIPFTTREGAERRQAYIHRQRGRQ